MVNGGLVVNSGLVVNGGLIDFLDGREDGRKIEPMKRMPHDSSPMWENASHRPVSYVINRARIIRILRGWRCSISRIEFGTQLTLHLQPHVLILLLSEGNSRSKTTIRPHTGPAGLPAPPSR
jgi:hypothetical protein